MSSEFLDVTEDVNGASVSLSMKATGNAFLTVSDDNNVMWYCLPPTVEGMMTALDIANALTDWAEHVEGRLNAVEKN